MKMYPVTIRRGTARVWRLWALPALLLSAVSLTASTIYVPRYIVQPHAYHGAALWSMEFEMNPSERDSASIITTGDPVKRVLVVYKWDETRAANPPRAKVGAFVAEFFFERELAMERLAGLDEYGQATSQWVSVQGGIVLVYRLVDPCPGEGVGIAGLPAVR